MSLPSSQLRADAAGPFLHANKKKFYKRWSNLFIGTCARRTLPTGTPKLKVLITGVLKRAVQFTATVSRVHSKLGHPRTQFDQNIDLYKRVQV
ncbi:hypothetical protein ANAPC5_01489 [Anaplasma phagocytophilum]|nr:hypothetical protein ANAPC5_01489 [Anaplasma phagocytophilum]